jgi:hypothetical protein
MTRKRLAIWLLVSVSVALFAFWIGSNTSWVDVKVPMLPKGQALINPFYPTQRFAETLGAKTTWDRTLALPRPDEVIVVSSWHWSLSTTRRLAMERWVESGGRLVVDNLLIDPTGAFAEWSGISVRHPPDPDAVTGGDENRQPVCRTLGQEFAGRAASDQEADRLWLCDAGRSWLTTRQTPQWALRDKQGLQAARMAIGRGSVTMINADMFVKRVIFDGDHGRIFVAATGLRRGDAVHFLSEDNYPSLLALTWRYGAPVVAVALTLLAVMLWRGAIRFGPPAPPTVAARRSLADQIRGTGHFALRFGSGQSLHTASVRALEEAAQRRISGYGGLTRDERLIALARVTGFDRDSLAAAIHHPGWRTAAELRRTLALLEAARRQTLIRETRLEHGTR